MNGASGVRGVISHLDLRDSGGDKSALNKICRRHSGEIKGMSRMTSRGVLQDAGRFVTTPTSDRLMRPPRRFMPELMSSLECLRLPPNCERATATAAARQLLRALNFSSAVMTLVARIRKMTKRRAESSFYSPLHSKLIRLLLTTSKL